MFGLTISLRRSCDSLQRIADKQMPVREVADWEKRRNQAAIKVIWQFTTTDARIKIRRLYPVKRAGSNLTRQWAAVLARREKG